MSWSEYVRAVAGDNQSEIARRVEISQSAVHKWFKGAAPKGPQVIAFANVYGRPRAEAILYASSLPQGEIDEVLKRLKIRRQATESVEDEEGRDIGEPG